MQIFDTLTLYEALSTQTQQIGFIIGLVIGCILLVFGLYFSIRMRDLNMILGSIAMSMCILVVCTVSGSVFGMVYVNAPYDQEYVSDFDKKIDIYSMSSGSYTNGEIRGSWLVTRGYINGQPYLNYYTKDRDGSYIHGEIPLKDAKIQIVDNDADVGIYQYKEISHRNYYNNNAKCIAFSHYSYIVKLKDNQFSDEIMVKP